MALFKNQSQYDELAKAELDLERALHDWKDAGGPLVDVLSAINRMIDLRVEIAHENISRE